MAHLCVDSECDHIMIKVEYQPLVARRCKRDEACYVAEESAWSCQAESLSAVRFTCALAINVFDLSLKSWIDLRAQIVKQRPNFQLVAEEMTVCSSACMCFIRH
jgi:hypothetical protein